MIPIRVTGANPASGFDSETAAIFKQTGRGKGEVAHVWGLMSDQSLRRLNTAASQLYDDNFNSVRFYGGVIHQTPVAKFTALAPGLSEKVGCELADLLVVVVTSSPDQDGFHQIKTTRGCLIQAKTSDAPGKQLAFSYVPGTSIPVGTNQTQFYLLNKWPPFTLSIGGHVHSYGLANPAGFPQGKYCYVWTGTGVEFDKWPFWSFGDPAPGLTATGSLGKLLEQAIDQDPNVGVPFGGQNAVPWDVLMMNLLGACRVRSPRLADPAGLSFQTFTDALADIATFRQRVRNPSPSRAAQYWVRSRDFLSDMGATREDGAMPVLIICVSSFRRDGDGPIRS